MVPGAESLAGAGIILTGLCRAAPHQHTGRQACISHADETTGLSEGLAMPSNLLPNMVALNSQDIQESWVKRSASRLCKDTVSSGGVDREHTQVCAL